MKYYIDNLTIEIIEAMTYKFILDLLIITEDRASEYISLDDLNIVRLDLPLKKFNNLKISDKGRERLANDTYQLILSSSVERYLCYSFLSMDIPDFQTKIESK